MCMGILPPLCLCTHVHVGFMTSEEGTGPFGTRVRDWVLWKNCKGSELQSHLSSPWEGFSRGALESHRSTAITKSPQLSSSLKRKVLPKAVGS